MKRLIPLLAFLIMMQLARADLLLEELPSRYNLDGFGNDVLVSVDACTDSTFAAITGNGKIFLSKLPEYWRHTNADWPPPDSLIAGDSSSLFGRPLSGREVVCEDEHSILVLDTWAIYRVRIDEKKVDTLLRTGNFMRNIIQDDSGHHYIVTSSELYRLGSAQAMAFLLGDVKDFAVQDQNRFLGLDGHSLFYYQSGKIDTIRNITDPRYLLISCMRIPSGYLVIDEKEQVFFFDPIANSVKKWITPPDFKATTGNGFSIQNAPFGDTLLISSGGLIFSLAKGGSNIVKEVFRNQRDSSLMAGTFLDPGFVFSISRRKSEGYIFLAAEKRVYRVWGSIAALPVNIVTLRLGRESRTPPLGLKKLPFQVNGRWYEERSGVEKKPKGHLLELP